MENSVDHYIQEWGLVNCEKLATTFTSDVFIADSRYGKVVLKILNKVGIEDELSGIFFLKNGQGRGAVNLFCHDEQALLMEYLPGENLYQYSKMGNEAEASRVFCEIIKKIHSVKEIKDRAKLKDYTSLFEIFGRVQFSDDVSSLVSQGKYIAEKLVSSQTEEVLLHGDLHRENVASRANGEFVCFDPKGLYGDPAYELGTTLKNPWDYPQISQDLVIFQERAKYFSKELKLPVERIIGFAFVHLCLSIAWAIEDNDLYDHQLKLAQQVAGILK